MPSLRAAPGRIPSFMLPRDRKRSFKSREIGHSESAGQQDVKKTGRLAAWRLEVMDDVFEALWSGNMG